MARVRRATEREAAAALSRPCTITPPPSLPPLPFSVLSHRVSVS